MSELNVTPNTPEAQAGDEVLQCYCGGNPLIFCLRCRPHVNPVALRAISERKTVVLPREAPAPDSEESEIVRNIRLTAPKRIFLNVGPDDSLDAPGDFKDLDLSEVTWCEDGQENCDVEYIRADQVSTLLEAVTKSQAVLAKWGTDESDGADYLAVVALMALLDNPSLVAAVKAAGGSHG